MKYLFVPEFQSSKLLSWMLAAASLISLGAPALAQMPPPGPPPSLPLEFQNNEAVVAYPTNASISPKKKALILEIVAYSTKGIADKNLTRKQMSNILPQVNNMMPKLIPANINLTTAQRKNIVDEAQKSLPQSFDKVESTIGSLQDILKASEEVTLYVYDKNFSVSELEEIVTFYRSPIGVKMQTLQPVIAEEIGKVTTPLILKRTQQMMQQMMDERQLFAPDKSTPQK
jgi:hypothetical protein